jgi:hypothetical protein
MRRVSTLARAMLPRIPIIFISHLLKLPLLTLTRTLSATADMSRKAQRMSRKAQRQAYLDFFMSQPPMLHLQTLPYYSFNKPTTHSTTTTATSGTAQQKTYLGCWIQPFCKRVCSCHGMPRENGGGGGGLTGLGTRLCGRLSLPISACWRDVEDLALL